MPLGGTHGAEDTRWQAGSGLTRPQKKKMYRRLVDVRKTHPPEDRAWCNSSGLRVWRVPSCVESRKPKEREGAGEKLEKELGGAARRARGRTREYESAAKATRGCKTGGEERRASKKRSTEEEEKRKRERRKRRRRRRSLSDVPYARWEVKDGEERTRKNDTAASKSFM